MTRRLLSFWLCFAFILPTAFSQKAPIKWGKISKADLEMTNYELDPEAGAIVLCDFGWRTLYTDYAYLGDAWIIADYICTIRCSWADGTSRNYSIS